MAPSLHTVLRDIRKQIDLALRLINEGADVNASDELGQTPLELSIQIDNASIVKLLIQKGASVDSREKNYGFTPLHLAAEFVQNVQILKLLINAGSDVRAKDDDGDTPLHRSVLNENVEICQFLIDAGAEVNVKNHHGETPLHHFVDYESNSEDADTLKCLIRAGADVNAEDKFKLTPLHHILCYNGFENLNAINILLETGADVNARSFDLETPLNYSLKNQYPTVSGLKLLMKAGFNVNDLNKSEATSLFLLISDSVDILTNVDETKKCIEFLIVYCDINYVNANEENIFAIVMEKYHASEHKENFYKFVLNHVAKLKVLELHVDARLINTIEAHDDYSSYFTKCLQELDEAKSTKLDISWVSFLNLLVDDEEKLVKYAGNKNLVEDFKKRVDNFPIFKTEMQNKMSKAIEDRKLFDAAAKTLSSSCPIFDSYHLIIRDVLNVMSEEDWGELSRMKRSHESN